MSIEARPEPNFEDYNILSAIGEERTLSTASCYAVFKACTRSPTPTPPTFADAEQYLRRLVALHIALTPLDQRNGIMRRHRLD